MRAARITRASVSAPVACVPSASAKSAKVPSVAPACPGIASPALAEMNWIEPIAPSEGRVIAVCALARRRAPRATVSRRNTSCEKKAMPGDARAFGCCGCVCRNTELRCDQVRREVKRCGDAEHEERACVACRGKCAVLHDEPAAEADERRREDMQRMQRCEREGGLHASHPRTERGSTRGFTDHAARRKQRGENVRGEGDAEPKREGELAVARDAACAEDVECDAKELHRDKAWERVNECVFERMRFRFCQVKEKECCTDQCEHEHCEGPCATCCAHGENPVQRAHCAHASSASSLSIAASLTRSTCAST